MERTRDRGQKNITTERMSLLLLPLRPHLLTQKNMTQKAWQQYHTKYASKVSSISDGVIKLPLRFHVEPADDMKLFEGREASFFFYGAHTS